VHACDTGLRVEDGSEAQMPALVTSPTAPPATNFTVSSAACPFG
jgi:hypothetical protein